MVQNIKMKDSNQKNMDESIQNSPAGLSHENIQIDFTREKRQGFAEVIYGEGKNQQQLLKIAKEHLELGEPVLFTRLKEGLPQKLRDAFDFGHWKLGESSQTLSWAPTGYEVAMLKGNVALVSAGASDEAVLEEAEMTLEHFGVKSFRVCDAGVAGIHRLLAHEEKLHSATMCIVAAGMDGALPSVVGGLVGCPVVAIPTSVGYGACFGGVSALLSMLNSCASGLSVVNIDNGYGAAMAAVRMLKVMDSGVQAKA
jgi:NCAIR mutase (PurE)-related protein